MSGEEKRASRLRIREGTEMDGASQELEMLWWRTYSDVPLLQLRECDREEHEMVEDERFLFAERGTYCLGLFCR